MRILFIHSELGMLLGGGENFSRNLIEALVGRKTFGHNCVYRKKRRYYILYKAIGRR